MSTLSPATTRQASPAALATGLAQPGAVLMTINKAAAPAVATGAHPAAPPALDKEEAQTTTGSSDLVSAPEETGIENKANVVDIEAMAGEQAVQDVAAGEALHQESDMVFRLRALLVQSRAEVVEACGYDAEVGRERQRHN